MSNRNYLNYIIDKIKVKNARHGKKLTQSLTTMPQEFLLAAEDFFGNYEKFALANGKTLEYGIESYLKMIADMMYEYVQFARTGEYTCKSFEDAYKRVYSNPEVMEYYMHGLLFSQFLWKHHYTVLNFFSDNLPVYTSDTKSYLEIGGGHGLYLSNAMHVIGKDSTYDMVDISESSLNMAKSFVTQPGVNFTLADIYDYEPAQKFDFITMGEVLEHVEDPIRLLSRLGELVSDTGTIFITTPTNAPAIDHIYLFRNEQEIVNMIESSGFVVEKSIAVFSEDVDKEEGAKRNIALLYGAFIKKK